MDVQGPPLTPHSKDTDMVELTGVHEVNTIFPIYHLFLELGPGPFAFALELKFNSSRVTAQNRIDIQFLSCMNLVLQSLLSTLPMKRLKYCESHQSRGLFSLNQENDGARSLLNLG